MSRKLWTRDEDQLLSSEMARSPGSEPAWEELALALRRAGHKKSAKQCRERWMNYLDPSLLRKEWNAEDNRKLLHLHELSGSKWKDIALHFPGRTDNSIKNQFFSLVRKSLRKARKAVSRNANTAEVNAIKPKILSSLLFQKIELPNDVLVPKTLLTDEMMFLCRSPVSLKEFVNVFAFGKSPESSVQSNPSITHAVDFILGKLEQQNSEYVSKKTRSRPLRDRRKKSEKTKEASLFLERKSRKPIKEKETVEKDLLPNLPPKLKMEEEKFEIEDKKGYSPFASFNLLPMEKRLSNFEHDDHLKAHNLNQSPVHELFETHKEQRFSETLEEERGVFPFTSAWPVQRKEKEEEPTKAADFAFDLMEERKE